MWSQLGVAVSFWQLLFWGALSAIQGILKEVQVEIHENGRFFPVHLVYSKEETSPWDRDPGEGGQSARGGSATRQWPEEGVLWLSRGTQCLGCQQGLGAHCIPVEQCSQLVRALGSFFLLPEHSV